MALRTRRSYGYTRAKQAIRALKAAMTVIIVLVNLLPFALLRVDPFLFWRPFTWILLLGIVSIFVPVVTITLNEEPDISVRGEYLEVQSFCLFRLKIPWNQVCAIYRSREINPFRPNRRHWVVIVRRATPLHRILGWQFARKFQPAIIYPPEISDCDDLVRQIHQRSGAAIVEE